METKSNLNSYKILIHSSIERDLFEQNFILPEILNCEENYQQTKFEIEFKTKIDTQDCLDTDFLIIRSQTIIDKSFVDTLLTKSKNKQPRLKFIGSCVTGTNHLDIKTIKNAGIELFIAEGANANAVSDYVIQQLLENLSEHIKKQTNVSGKCCLGIVGIGNIGKSLYKKATALGFSVLCNDPPRLAQEKNKLTFNHTELDELLAKSDYISLHIPLNKDKQFATHQLINSSNLNKIKSDALLINTSRGGIIDEQAWQAFSHRKIIDCWQNEPNINPNLATQTCLATPHIAGHSFDAKRNAVQAVIKAIYHFLQKREGKNKKNILALEKLLAKTKLVRLEHSKINCLKDLIAIIKEVKDYRADDLFERKTLTSTPNSQLVIHSEQLAAKFKQYRQNYPVHFELSNYILQANKISIKMRPATTALGFRLE